MEHENDFYWHALNYRTAFVTEAHEMWQELEACMNRLIAAEREACADRLRNAENLLRFLAGIKEGNEVDLLSLREEARKHFRRSNVK